MEQAELIAQWGRVAAQLEANTQAQLALAAAIHQLADAIAAPVEQSDEAGEQAVETDFSGKPVR